MATVCLTIFQVILGRLILLTYNMAAVALAVIIKKENKYGALGLLTLFQIAECIYMIKRRKGYEYKWVSLSTVLFLVAAIPPMWFMELHVLSAFNSTLTVSSPSDVFNSMLKDNEKVALQFLKQTLLLVIMIHRWVIPRGSLTRNLLSQLLFVFFAMSSDILELFDLFDLQEVKRHKAVGYAILSVWTVSLTQMCMVLTNTRNVIRSRPAKIEEEGETDFGTTGRKTQKSRCIHFAFSSDIWSLLMTVFLMDLPFLVVRLYIIIVLKVIQYGIIFFTVKNCLVILLSVYRFWVICFERDDYSEENNGQQIKIEFWTAGKKDSKQVQLTPSTNNKVEPFAS